MKTDIYQGTAYNEPVPLAVLLYSADETLPDVITGLVEAEDITGESETQLLLYTRNTLSARRLLLIGLGERQQITPELLRQVGAHAVRKAQALKLPSLHLQLPTFEHLPLAQVAQALAEGFELGQYRYLDQKSELSAAETHTVATSTLVIAPTTSATENDAITAAVRRGQIIAQGSNLARNLQNTPGNQMVPARLAAVAQELATETRLTVTVFEQADLEERGFGGLLAVGKGSAQEPRFIIIEHGEATADRPTICLVGKGITFDTGGISIKPADKMDLMKMDMGGAAAVLGAMQTIAALELPLHVVGLISSAENMPGPNAYKPGDVIQTLSGKTVEVLNTDAEGRIVLADALFFAQQYQPQAIIDLATLTGGIVVALGPHAIGLMGNNQELVERVLAAGEASGERAWQLPLWDAYRKMIKSEVADIRNTGGGRQASSITAAAFLDAFVGDYPWAHLDIAGTAWSDGKHTAYTSDGATGVGVRLLAYLLLYWAETL